MCVFIFIFVCFFFHDDVTILRPLAVWVNVSCSLTLDGRRANYERLLEGFSLGTELCWSGLQRNTLLGQTWDVDGGLLVESRLVVQQWDITAE